ncbi:MBL fold metallo-hydrolase [Rathayibacter sp. VKM Ac-2835]|uniref:MBL fold metallo-hydrolase n=1 Tax=Rathayibacter sp. VKM Ac-2835 TaxID=2739043 RepID=UPI00156507FC|nr:MBL fold metallo-hydrolase [Rathayibacter sp. VKM Ac-2835]NRG42376.1 MBL fold metallo-hydrolase [Rathayibacter sp. VKM Ac-2835]
MSAYTGGRRRGGPSLHRHEVEGVHRLEHAFTNLFLLEEGGRLTVVDAGLPGTWPHLLRTLHVLGRGLADIDALVLTHAHFDHLGFARRLRERGVPVWLHPADARLAAHPYSYRRQRTPLLYPLRHPSAVPVLGAMARAGALRVPPLTGTTALEPGAVLDVPGSPVVLATPGHTDGHVSLHLPERGAVIGGDALVTLDPYSARTGPHLVARAATADTAVSLASLDVLAATGAAVLLPGHGVPWRSGVAQAADVAARRPIA